MHQIVGPVLGAFVGGPRVIGYEHVLALPRAALICPNHQSHLDIPILRRALGGAGRHRLAIAAADDYWFRRRLYRLFVSWFAAVPFRRLGRGAESIRMVEDLLAHGWRVIVFPEGTRSRTGRMGPFKPGAGLIAVQTGIPVLPVRMMGAWEVLPPGRVRPSRRQVTVRFGELLYPRDGEAPRAFTARVEAAVRSL
ncbi:MAG: lysophospholipid acyltransferase family protein [Chloroflexota bacterium]